MKVVIDFTQIERMSEALALRIKQNGKDHFAPSFAAQISNYRAGIQDLRLDYECSSSSISAALRAENSALDVGA